MKALSQRVKGVSVNGSVHWTPKMLNVLKSIVRKNPDGSLLDIYQLMELHGNGSTRMAMRQTLYTLEARGMIRTAGYERRSSDRYGRPRRLLEATDAGAIFMRPKNLPGG